MKIRPSNVPIAATHLPLALRIRNFSNPKARRTSQSAARNADRQGSHNGIAIAATEASVRCFPRFVPNAARAPKFLSNLATTGPFIVAIAIVMYDLVDNLLP